MSTEELGMSGHPEPQSLLREEDEASRGTSREGILRKVAMQGLSGEHGPRDLSSQSEWVHQNCSVHGRNTAERALGVGTVLTRRAKDAPDGGGES